MNILTQIPFSYAWIVRNLIGKDKEIKTVLDLGCGRGEFMSSISLGKNWEIIGVELDKKSAKKAEQSGIYKKIIISSVINLPDSITEKKFDLVFCSHIIEHLRKTEGKKALKVWEKLAKKSIIILTPQGFLKYHPLEKANKEENPLHKHLSGWELKEFDNRGYKIRGQGFRLIYGEHGLGRKVKVPFILLSCLGFIFSPLIYFYPILGTHIIAIKKL